MNQKDLEDILRECQYRESEVFEFKTNFTSCKEISKQISALSNSATLSGGGG